MPGNILNNLSGAAVTPESTSSLSPQTEALLHVILQHGKEGPMASARMGAKEVSQRLLARMENQQGIHFESLLCSLGALSGYACQAYLRAQAVARGMRENSAFLVVDTSDGKQFFFGDPLNKTLVNSQYSLWSLAATAARQVGAEEFPDMNELFEHTASVLGSKQFGIPRIAEQHRAKDLPLNYLKDLWPELLPVVKSFCPAPANWPIVFGMATQEAIIRSKDLVEPALALKIVLESAIPMSKVDLANS